MMRTHKPDFGTAVALVLLLTAVNPLGALASLTDSQQSRLSDYETTVFGATRPNFSTETRLRALETNLFGKAKSGNDSKRLDAIAKLMTGAKPAQVQYFPPMAPSLDRSTFAPTPKDAPILEPSPEPERRKNDYRQSPVERADNDDDRSQNLLRKALSSYQAGRITEAEGGFAEVLKVDPGNGDAHYNLGAIAEERGDLPAAARHYKAALDRNPGDNEIKEAYISVSRKVTEEQNLKQVQQSQSHKQDMRKLADEAALAYKAGNFQVAINKLETIRQSEPNDPNVYFGLAQAYRGQGNLMRARDLLSQAQRLAPNNQLYRSTAAEIDAQSRHSQSAGNQPQAPAYGNSAYDQNAGTTAYDDAPAGQLTPFSDQGMDRLNDDRVSGGGLGGLGALGALGSLGGLRRGGYGSLGSVGGLGGLGGLSTLGGLGGYTMLDGRYPGGSTRVKRVVTSSLAGAALGAFASKAQHGNVKSGAMKGAMFGGLYGLMGQ